MKKNISSAIIIFFMGICLCLNSCNDKIKITEKEALHIAKRYGIYGQNVEILFKTYTYSKTSLGYQKGKRKLYYWDISKKCNHCPFIQIDAVTGNVFSEGKYNYVY